MSNPAVLLLSDAATPEDYFLPAEKLIQGNPKQSVVIHYTDPSKQFVVGVWRSEPGKWHVRYTEEEYCCMLSGKSVVSSDSGQAVTLVAGDEFVVPAGFVGTWEVVETTTKRFVIYEKHA